MTTLLRAILYVVAGIVIADWLLAILGCAALLTLAFLTGLRVAGAREVVSLTQSHALCAKEFKLAAEEWGARRVLWWPLFAIMRISDLVCGLYPPRLQAANDRLSQVLGLKLAPLFVRLEQLGAFLWYERGLRILWYRRLKDLWRTRPTVAAIREELSTPPLEYFCESVNGFSLRLPPPPTNKGLN